MGIQNYSYSPIPQNRTLPQQVKYVKKHNSLYNNKSKNALNGTKKRLPDAFLQNY